MLDRLNNRPLTATPPPDGLVFWLLTGPATVVAAVSITSLLGWHPLLVIAVTATVSIALYRLRVVRERERLARLERGLREANLQLNSWHQRWELLHAETRQNASVLLQMTDGIVVLSPDRSILLINPSARRLLLLGQQEKLLGRPFPGLVRIPEINSMLREVALRHRPQEVLVEVGDGANVRPLRVRVDRIDAVAEGNLLLTIRDETETRRVDEIRREFVANVSHELKTPLAAIKGYAETVELAIEDDPQAASHFMKQIRSQCQRLEALVADMMQLARAQTGRSHLNITEVVLGDVIADSFKSYLPVARAKGIQLTVENRATDAVILADREATLTITNNLIGNAIRYTPPDGNVIVDVRNEDGFWALSVSDDGVGIPHNEQDRIFERFYRVEKTRQSASGGTGLGLAIVKNLALAQGGRVKLTSQPGQGSRFEVWLPVSAAVESSLSAS